MYVYSFKPYVKNTVCVNSFNREACHFGFMTFKWRFVLKASNDMKTTSSRIANGNVRDSKVIKVTETSACTVGFRMDLHLCVINYYLLPPPKKKHLNIRIIFCKFIRMENISILSLS